MQTFHKKILSQISLWAWAATVLPIVSLAGLFFIDFIGTDTYYQMALVVGAIAMFAVAVVWWWWAIYTIAKLTLILGDTSEKFDKVTGEFKEIRKDINSLKQ